MLYLPTVAAWCWLCSSRLRSGSACTSCCCRSCPLRNCSFNFQLPVRSAYYQFIYDSFLSAHRIPPKKTARRTDLRRGNKAEIRFMNSSRPTKFAVMEFYELFLFFGKIYLSLSSVSLPFLHLLIYYIPLKDGANFM